MDLNLPQTPDLPAIQIHKTLHHTSLKNDLFNREDSKKIFRRFLILMTNIKGLQDIKSKKQIQ